MTCPAESRSGAPGAASMPRAAAPTGATSEVMAGMPSAGPPVMVVPIPDDGAGHRTEHEVVAVGAQGEGVVGGGGAQPGAVGEGSDGHVLGHLDQGHVRIPVPAEEAGALERAAGADEREVLEPARARRPW